MVRSGRLTLDSLSVVPVSGGVARMGSWGILELTGPNSAWLRLVWSEDKELPTAVAVDVTSGVLLLSAELGRLLFLPYAGELAAVYDLRTGEPVYPAIELLRDDDHGMRMASVRVVTGLGAVHLTEVTLSCFREDCTLAWRHDGDFGGWSVEVVGVDTLGLVCGDWSGRERRQVWALASGQRLS